MLKPLSERETEMDCVLIRLIIEDLVQSKFWNIKLNKLRLDIDPLSLEKLKGFVANQATNTDKTTYKTQNPTQSLDVKEDSIQIRSKSKEYCSFHHGSVVKTSK